MMLQAFTWAQQQFNILRDTGELPDFLDCHDSPWYRYVLEYGIDIAIDCNPHMDTYCFGHPDGPTADNPLYEIRIATQQHSEEPEIVWIAVIYPDHVVWTLDNEDHPSGRINYSSPEFSASWIWGEKNTIALNRADGRSNLAVSKELTSRYKSCCGPIYKHEGFREAFPLHHHTHQLQGGRLIVVPAINDPEALGWELLDRQKVLEVIERAGRAFQYITSGETRLEWYHPILNQWQKEPYHNPEVVRV